MQAPFLVCQIVGIFLSVPAGLPYGSGRSVFFLERVPHIIGELGSAVLYLFFHMLQVLVIRDARVGGDDADGGGDTAGNAEDRRADADGVVNVFAV